MATTGTTTQQTTESSENLTDRLRSALARLTNQQKILLMIAVAAIIAIAGVGFMMLTGRMNWRHGAIVIVGCFIIFGAASIVAGIQTAAGG